MHGMTIAPAQHDAPTPRRRRRRRREPAAIQTPRLYVPGPDADADAMAVADRFTPFESGAIVNGNPWPLRAISWTAAEWDALGEIQPTHTFAVAGGGRMLLIG